MRFIVYSIASLILLFLSSCAPIPNRDTLATRISGRVIDGAGNPIEGARLRYVFRGHKALGETETDSCGRFTFGPFHQWFYLVYIGSPGVAPFPLLLSAHGVPDCIVAEHEGATSITLRGTPSAFVRPETGKSTFVHLLEVRWLGETDREVVLRPSDRMTELPRPVHQLQGITIGSLLGISQPPKL